MDILLFLGQSLFYDSLILSSVSFIVKKKIPALKYAVAVGVSLFASLLLFLTVPILLVFVPILTIKIAFSPRNIKDLGVNLAYFYTFSAVLSGALHMLRYFVNFEYLAVVSFLFVAIIIATVISVIFMTKAKFLKKTQRLNDFERQVTLYYGDEVVKGIGFIDTGNSLIDHLTGQPVMIVPQIRTPGIEKMISLGLIKTWPLGFSVVGEDESYMLAFKPTLLLIDNKIVKDVVIALCETEFSQYDFLLQPELID